MMMTTRFITRKIPSGPFIGSSSFFSNVSTTTTTTTSSSSSSSTTTTHPASLNLTSGSDSDNNNNNNNDETNINNQNQKQNQQNQQNQQKNQRPIFVAATKQHVGKTSVSLALMSGIQKRFSKVGFIKPVGQQHVTVPSHNLNRSILVDKDVSLVREHFQLYHIDYQHMSPVIIPRGYTKKYIDGDITYDEQMNQISESFFHVSNESDIVLCEGTGHCAVGSIVGVNNAKVASLLGADMVLVANGGLGSAFDELELNRVLCQHYNVRIAGVVINKVIPDKLEQTKQYMDKALKNTWGVPLLACIPDWPFLGSPALFDLEQIFSTKLISGTKHRFRHYNVNCLNLVTTNLTRFLENLRTKSSRTLYICHVTRDDLILGFMAEAQRPRSTKKKKKNENNNNNNGNDGEEEEEEVEEEEPFEAALMICGRKDKYNVSNEVRDMIASLEDAPIMMVEGTTHDAMKKIHEYTPKLNIDDKRRVEKAIEHYEPYIDFDELLRRTSSSNSSFNEPGTISYEQLRHL